MSNELTIKQQSAPVSVFDDFDAFEKALKMAEALSKTKLIPINFQNCPEDCLIAIDYSRRLAIPPTAIMPHLYIIGGRPSTSAQFMISLVNRSGQFTRIQWDETTNGTVEFMYNGVKKTVPNYSAVAWFEETSTGRRHKSPVIDVKFAQANGWLVKRDKYGKETESKWQVMPQVMCRYRSASILIKTVCPELALGMETTEDIQDGAIEPAVIVRPTSAATNDEQIDETIDAVVIEPAKSDNAQEAEFYELKDAIETADSETLRSLGRKIADSGLADHYLDELRDAFKARRAAIAAANKPQPAATEPAEKKEKTPRKKAANKTDDEPKTKPELTSKFAADLNAAATYPDLTALWEQIEAAIVSGNITSGQYAELEKAFNVRVGQLKTLFSADEIALFKEYETRVENAEGDKDQKGWARELMLTIQTQTNGALISKNNLATADEWLASGAFTQSLRDVVVEYARARLDRFF